MIAGGRITGVEGRKLRDGQATGMAVNINIDDVRADGGRVVVAYTYSIDYQPGLAKMSVSGEVFLDEKNSGELAEKWKKTRQFPPSLAEEMLTAINYAASAVGTLLAFALGVNAPLAVSRARIAQPAQPPGPAKETKAA